MIRALRRRGSLWFLAVTAEKPLDEAVRVGRVPVALTRDAADHPSGAVDEEGVRMREHAEGLGSPPVRVDPERKADSEFGGELPHGRRIFT